MAKFKYYAVDTLMANFNELAGFSAEDADPIIRPGAEVLLNAQKNKIISTFTQRTGSLAASLKIAQKIANDTFSLVISPSGKHPKSTTGDRHSKGRSNGHYSGTNAEILYILEYGSPRIPARHVIETANEEAEEEAYAAIGDAWNAYLTSKGV
jgi:hypothetical protein